ncbi:MAG: host attachment protein [Rhizobiales bacterium]|nr:host attachment protein [Hyphomicrobiales bacterium]
MRDETRKTWIVVADGGHARILLNKHRDEGVSELPLVSKHDPRLAHHHRELASGVHHEPVFKPTEEKRNEDRFLNTLAETVQTGVAKKECDQLVLVAPATAMGLLRKALSKQTHQHVVAEIVHDYTHQDNATVWKHVKDKMPL